jgi:uncharacterized DUF497 family protein
MNVSFELNGLVFEWDDQKARFNEEKQGVRFEEAAEAFFDIFAVREDASVSEEERFALVGYTFSNRLLVVVHVERRETTRIISARTAQRAERSVYERFR